MERRGFNIVAAEASVGTVLMIDMVKIRSVFDIVDKRLRIETSPVKKEATESVEEMEKTSYR